MSKNEIIADLYESEELEKVISEIVRGGLKDDLKSELFLILCEMSSKEIKDAYEKGYLIYLCINIIKKQYNSSTSPFHYKWRKNRTSEIIIEVPAVDEGRDLEEYEDEFISKLLLFLETVPVVERELFKMYYKLAEYDRCVGTLRDKMCKKPTSSTRKMEKKLSLNAVEGQKRVTIDHSTIALYLKQTLALVREEFKDYKRFKDIIL